MSVAQWLRRQVVALEIEGSTPSTHPTPLQAFHITAEALRTREFRVRDLNHGIYGLITVIIKSIILVQYVTLRGSSVTSPLFYQC